MQSEFSPLKLSLVGFRLTGYLIETNLRIAKVLCEAAMKANPVLDTYDATASTKVKQQAKMGSKPKLKAKPEAKSVGAKRKREPSMPPAMTIRANGEARL